MKSLQHLFVENMFNFFLIVVKANIFVEPTYSCPWEIHSSPKYGPDVESVFP